MKQEFKLIDAQAKNGNVYIVQLGNDLARAFWTGDMWAYDLGAHSDSKHQIDFEPTHYAPLYAERS